MNIQGYYRKFGLATNDNNDTKFRAISNILLLGKQNNYAPEKEQKFRSYIEDYSFMKAQKQKEELSSLQFAYLSEYSQAERIDMEHSSEFQSKSFEKIIENDEIFNEIIDTGNVYETKFDQTKYPVYLNIGGKTYTGEVQYSSMNSDTKDKNGKDKKTNDVFMRFFWKDENGKENSYDFFK